jgi:peptide deformylase
MPRFWQSGARSPAPTGEATPLTIAGTGELSRCLQHETDHLNGILYIDRLTGQHRKDALRQLRL